MAVSKQYQSDVEALLAKRHDSGWDYWTTPDRRLAKGSPFSAIDCAYILKELGMDSAETIMKETAGLILDSWREDGRFKLSPQGAIYPCQTIHAARTLARLGYASDTRLKKTFEHLLEIRHNDGGWRCNKFSFGRGPETEFSNPGPTLMALDAFRFTDIPNKNLDQAVDFLLAHWESRIPLGPCHYGIGSLFLQVAFPFLTYNLFYYVYVLSFYDKARNDGRFVKALDTLESGMVNGRIIVERPNQKLAGFNFCKKGEASDLAMERYHEILKNIGRE